MARVEFTRGARVDLQELLDYIAADAGAARATGYVERIEKHAQILELFPLAGRKRTRSGTRAFAFERRVLLIYRVSVDTVRILRVIYAGRDLPFD